MSTYEEGSKIRFHISRTVSIRYRHWLCVKSCRDHMYDVRNQDHRDRQVGDGTVRLLDQGQKPELRNREVNGTADQSRNNFFL